jgi:hypothetical protein
MQIKGGTPGLVQMFDKAEIKDVDEQKITKSYFIEIRLSIPDDGQERMMS